MGVAGGDEGEGYGNGLVHINREGRGREGGFGR